MRTVYPIGTTIYDPEKCYNGYSLYCIPQGRFLSPVILIDMNGNVVQKWNVGGYAWHTCRAKLLNNGNLLVLEMKKGERQSGPREYSWDGHLVWEYEPWRLPEFQLPIKAAGYAGAHHDISRLENGNTLILCREEVPEEYKEKIKDPVRRNVRPLLSDLILEVTPDKEVVWEWHMYQHLDINRYCEICSPIDWTHTNTARVLPENKWYDAGDERFKPGNIILSPRNLSFILLVDKTTKEIVWEYIGDYAGGLAGQHEPHMIEKGLPGEGNIIIFDNGAPPMRSLAHAGKTFILEIDPVTKKIVWMYDHGQIFHSAFRSSVQRLPNGNTFICSAEESRLFEVTREGEIVWEYIIEWNIGFGSPRANRYSYDYCPQLRDLEKPEEKKVVPPPHVVTRPRTGWQERLPA